MARILVTGGAGFIGSEVIRQLKVKQSEFKVRAMDLVRHPDDDIERFTGSIMDINDVSQAVQGCDYVMHMAAMLGVKRTEQQRLSCLNVNIQGTINILDACVKARVKKVVLMSSSEVYGDARENPISEDTPLSPKSVYAVSKLAGEEYCRAYFDQYGLEFSVVRFFNSYGPGQVAEFVLPRFVSAVMDDKPPTVYGSGEQIRAFCYVGDSARGAISVLLHEDAHRDVYQIGNDQEPISMRALAEKVIRISGKDLSPRFVNMSDSDRSSGREIQERVPDISKARKLLGYEPKVSLDEGIRRMFSHGEVPKTWFDPMD